jgi:hypothetical protein
MGLRAHCWKFWVSHLSSKIDSFRNKSNVLLSDEFGDACNFSTIYLSIHAKKPYFLALSPWIGADTKYFSSFALLLGLSPAKEALGRDFK